LATFPRGGGGEINTNLTKIEIIVLSKKVTITAKQQLIISSLTQGQPNKYFYTCKGLFTHDRKLPGDSISLKNFLSPHIASGRITVNYLF
jgi:hypothetical protein